MVQPPRYLLLGFTCSSISLGLCDGVPAVSLTPSQRQTLHRTPLVQVISNIISSHQYFMESTALLHHHHKTAPRLRQRARRCARGNRYCGLFD
ncbi:hypothetical protein EDD22DRAFT_862491, partial [Suillus occidentalis]